MASPNFSAIQAVFAKQIDLLLSSSGLTTPIKFNYGITNKNICPNCIFDVNLKKSSNKYKAGGPVPFIVGRICPYCNGVGYYGIESYGMGYMTVIWDNKKWINPPPNIINSNGFIQTICSKDYIGNINKAKDITVMYSETGSNPVYRLYASPTPAGLGDNRYLFCMWELVTSSNIVPNSLS